jgi:hypothetical protein
MLITDSEEIFIEIVDTIALFIPAANHATTTFVENLRHRILPIQRSFLEHDSEIMLKTALRVYSALTEETSFPSNYSGRRRIFSRCYQLSKNI